MAACRVHPSFVIRGPAEESTMRQLLNDIGAYVRAIFWEGRKWLFGLFDILGIILFFLPKYATRLELSKPLIQSIGGGVFLLSFVGANFIGYRELLRRAEKKPAQVRVQKRSVGWGSGGSAQGIPINPFICRIHLDVKNEGDEPGRLNFISIDRMELGTTFVSNQPSRVLWHKESDNPNQGSIPITFPYAVEAEAWNIRLECRIETTFLVTSPDEWAKQMSDLREFSIGLSYEYETFSGEQHRGTLVVQGSFTDFRKSVLKGWLTNKRYDLFSTAVDIDSLIDNLCTVVGLF